MMTNTVFLSLGSNRGDRAGFLRDATRAIAGRIGPVSGSSGIYETDPWGFSDDTPFLNQVLKITTGLAAPLVLARILAIEQSLGRAREPGPDKSYQSRTIDIDILFFNREQIQEDNLIIPHPRIPLRRFVLVPLHELAPGLVHPILGLTVSELLAACPDTSTVRKVM